MQFQRKVLLLVMCVVFRPQMKKQLKHCAKERCALHVVSESVEHAPNVMSIWNALIFAPILCAENVATMLASVAISVVIMQKAFAKNISAVLPVVKTTAPSVLNVMNMWKPTVSIAAIARIIVARVVSVLTVMRWCSVMNVATVILTANVRAMKIVSYVQ